MARLVPALFDDTPHRVLSTIAIPQSSDSGYELVAFRKHRRAVTDADSRRAVQDLINHSVNGVVAESAGDEFSDAQELKCDCEPRGHQEIHSHLSAIRAP